MISIYFYNEIDIHVLAYEGLSTYKLYSNFSFYNIGMYIIEACIMKSLSIQSFLVTTLILKKAIRMKMNLLRKIRMKMNHLRKWEIARKINWNEN